MGNFLWCGSVPWINIASFEKVRNVNIFRKTMELFVTISIPLQIYNEMEKAFSNPSAKLNSKL